MAEEDDEPAPVQITQQLTEAAPDLVAAIQLYLGWGAKTGSDRYLLENRFRAALIKAGITPAKDEYGD